jgi:dienelactone hydrolase
MQPVLLRTTTFTLQSYVRWQKGNPLLIVYLEGDGAAWITPTRLSADPTPKEATALMMASQDYAGNVAYLARPCQFVAEKERQNCSPHYWSNARFAPEVVRALREAVLQLQHQSGAERLRLVGYSGGGSLAILLAADLQPEWLVTVAAPLDSDAWTHWHHLSPLDLSQNPRTAWRQLAGMRQRHWVGGQDEVIPKELSRQILSSIAGGTELLQEEPTFDHYCCWGKQWAALLKKMDW